LLADEVIDYNDLVPPLPVEEGAVGITGDSSGEVLSILASIIINASICNCFFIA
jgi:hypothetical protein